jgi:hypothetical protein
MKAAKYFWFILSGMAALTSCSSPKPQLLPQDELTVMEARASLHDSWAIAEAQHDPASSANVSAIVRARLSMIRSKALHHEVIDGNDLSYAERGESGGEITFKDCTLVTAKGDLTVAAAACLMKDHAFTFSGRPVRSSGGTFSLGREETVIALWPAGPGGYSMRTTGQCATVLPADPGSNRRNRM